jgi:hypothetical protein
LGNVKDILWSPQHPYESTVPTLVKLHPVNLHAARRRLYMDDESEQLVQCSVPHSYELPIAKRHASDDVGGLPRSTIRLNRCQSFPAETYVTKQNPQPATTGIINIGNEQKPVFALTKPSSSTALPSATSAALNATALSRDSSLGKRSRECVDSQENDAAIQSFLSDKAPVYVEAVFRTPQQSRHKVKEMHPAEVWCCPKQCGQSYKRTSTKSIHQHIVDCRRRDGFDTASK